MQRVLINGLNAEREIINNKAHTPLEVLLAKNINNINYGFEKR